MVKEVECFIVNEYYHLLSICKKYTKNDDFAQELLHFVILELYEKKEINVVLDWTNINRYIVHIITINWCSKESPFYRKIKKFSMNDIDLLECMQIVSEEYNHADDKLLMLLEEEYGDLDWFDKLQFQTYLISGNLKGAAEQGNTTISKVWHNLQQTKKQIKDNILEKLNN